MRKESLKAREKLIVAMAVAIPVVAISLLGWLMASNHLKSTSEKHTQLAKNSQDYAGPLKDIANDEYVNEISVDNFLNEFERYYDDSIQQVRESDPAKWDQAMVDKAYFCLLYVYKTKAYEEVESMAIRIDGARLAGVKVDANSARIKKDSVQKMRDEAEKKIDEEVTERAKESAEEDTEL